MVFKKKYGLMLLPVFALLLAGISCNVSSPYYQKQVAIPNTAWAYDFQPVFKITVSDTASRYRMYFLLRHDENFPYSNIWFRMKVKAPGDSVFSDGDRIEADLADPQGKWLGKGMGGIWEQKIPLATKDIPLLNRKGDYEIKIEQIMRMDPLPSVLNVGLMVEKLPRKRQ
jgi:gliding motility-associated lipoprotein GldH